MKARYILPKDQDIVVTWDKVSKHFNSKVKQLEDDSTKILQIPSGIRIIQTETDSGFVFKIGGASNDDISALTSFLGEPIRVGQEKLSLNDFAHELFKIKGVENKSIDDIIDHLDMDKTEFQEHFKKLERFGKRGRGPKHLLDAYKLLNKD